MLLIAGATIFIAGFTNEEGLFFLLCVLKCLLDKFRPDGFAARPAAPSGDVAATPAGHANADPAAAATPSPALIANSLNWV